jgi:hypothetical protein
LEKGGRKERRVQDHVHLDRETLQEATELLARYGEHAVSEAAFRADRSRALGNVVHFCRWRQIERTIEMLRTADVTGSIH